jgi:hypothetical protein
MLDTYNVSAPELSSLPELGPIGQEAGAVIHLKDEGLRREPPAAEGKEKKRKTESESITHTATSKKARNEAKKWEAPFVYTDSDSPLATADLRVGLSRSVLVGKSD